MEATDKCELLVEYILIFKSSNMHFWSLILNVYDKYIVNKYEYYEHILDTGWLKKDSSTANVQCSFYEKGDFIIIILFLESSELINLIFDKAQNI